MSAGLYVHFPFCLSRCDYCSFVSCCDKSLEDEYAKRIEKEAQFFSFRKEFDTLYFGGGTPSCVPNLIKKINDIVKRNFIFTKNYEFTVECNPDTVNDSLIDLLHSIGCNRVSLGLQSADDEILSAVGRRHNFKQFVEAIKKVKTLTQNVSVDIMLGLPRQDLESVKDTVEKAIGEGATHISVYALKVEDGTALKKRGYTVNEDLQADMYDIACQTLKENGFYRYEVSNFCKIGFESRHNLKYWNLDEYLGLGAGAHSYYGKKRYEGVGLKEYLLETQPNVVDVSSDFDEELIMLSLRTQRGLEISRLSNKDEFLKKNKKRIEDYVKNGFLEFDGSFLRLTESAFYVMNSIIVDLI